MKKIVSFICAFLFCVMVVNTKAQVNNLPVTKSLSGYNTEIKKGIEKTTAAPITLNKENNKSSVVSNRGSNPLQPTPTQRQVIISNFPASDQKAMLPTSSLKTSATVCDTFVNYTAIDSLTYYSYHYTQNGQSKFGGYYSGNNHYKDKAKAEFFNITSPGAQLSTVYLLFGKATYTSATTSKVNIKVWDNTGTNGGPGTVLGTKSVKIKDIATDVTNFDFTTVTFTSPITVNTAFYVGVELPTTTGDTVVLYTTTVYNQNTNTAYEKWSDNSWIDYYNSWGYSLNHFIAAALCVTSNVDANFSASKTTVSVGESVDFTDLSTGTPTSWSWDFTGAVPYSSTQQNPTVTYYTPGTYTVSLTAGDGFANDTETKTAYVTVVAATSSVCDTLHNMDFNNDSITIYLNSSTTYPGGYWSGHNGWGDLTFAEYFYGYPAGYELNSVMLGFGVAEYASATTSVVKVKVYDNTGANGSPGNVLATKSVKIKDIATDVTNGDYTTVSFTSPVTITTPYYVGVEVTYAAGDTVALYTNTVYNGKPNTAWTKLSDNTWAEFGDGTVNWGYNLSLLVLPIMCPVVTASAPVADFSGNATTVYVGNSVDFTDLSSNTPTSWAWAFTGGIPASSTVQNPTGIVYNNVGIYTVSLVATNANGSDTETKTAYITVVDTTTSVPTNADFVAVGNPVAVGGSVNFTDLSVGNPTSWSWTFTGGSPSTSTAQNPTGIVYNTAGTYTVTLTASGTNGTDTETKTNYINVVVAPTYCDTLTNVDAALDTPSVYFLGTGKGYVSGHNYYMDIAKADYYSNYTPGSTLTEASMWFGVAKYSNATTSKITVKVWDNTGTNGAPGTVLASETVTNSSIAADILQYQLTNVVFTTPATITTPFYVGFEFTYKTGDTVAMVLNLDGETVPGTAWEQWSDNTWYPYTDANSWGMNVGHYMFPVLCYQGTVTGINDILIDNVVNIYPNPNNGVFNLSTLLKQSSNMEVTVVNMLGEAVYTTKYNNVMAGNFTIDLSGQSAGVYSVKIQTNDQAYTKQVVIAK